MTLKDQSKLTEEEKNTAILQYQRGEKNSNYNVKQYKNGKYHITKKKNAIDLTNISTTNKHSNKDIVKKLINTLQSDEIFEIPPPITEPSQSKAEPSENKAEPKPTKIRFSIF
jgi:hypothetical protein